MNRVVTIKMDMLREGQSSDAWRNHSDGTYFAVGGQEQAATLEDARSKVSAVRASGYGQQYTRIDVELTDVCGTCYGSGLRHVQTRRFYGTRPCLTCKGKRNAVNLAEYSV